MGSRKSDQIMEKKIQTGRYQRVKGRSFIYQFLFLGMYLTLMMPVLSFAKDAVSVGVVNVTFLMENAPQSDIASNELKEKFLPQEKKLAEALEEINTLETELKKLVASKSASTDLKRQKERELRARKRKRGRSLQDFSEELRFARDAALDDVQKEVFSAIDAVRRQENIDIIIQDYISADKRVDITPLVLEYLRQKIENKQLQDEEKDFSNLKNEKKSSENNNEKP